MRQPGPRLPRPRLVLAAHHAWRGAVPGKAGSKGPALASLASVRAGWGHAQDPAPRCRRRAHVLVPRPAPQGGLTVHPTLCRAPRTAGQLRAMRHGSRQCAQHTSPERSGLRPSSNHQRRSSAHAGPRQASRARRAGRVARRRRRACTRCWVWWSTSQGAWLSTATATAWTAATSARPVTRCCSSWRVGRPRCAAALRGWAQLGGFSAAHQGGTIARDCLYVPIERVSSSGYGPFAEVQLEQYGCCL